MHYHMTEYAQWSRKIIQICSIKIQFYIVTFFLEQCTTNFSKLCSFKLMHLSDCTFLNIENDPFTSQEVTSAHLSEEIWGNVSIYYILLKEWGVRNSSVTKKAGIVESPKLYFFSISPFSLSLSLSLSFFLSHSYHSHEKTSIKGTIMQVSVIYALKPEKWHNMQYKSLNIRH